jgi:prolyl-tRNA synthetase
MRNFIAGANQADAHYVHVNRDRDFTVSEFADVRLAAAGDKCPRCEDGTLEEARGIEVGHIFKLGTKYSGSMGATFTDENGELKPILMGSYGIGMGRTMASVIEASHDADGIIWPVEIAPFSAVIVVANVKDEAAQTEAQRLHDALNARGIDVMLDDRDERAGVKFKDADLIGYPVRIVIGKGLANGMIEIRARRDAASAREVPVADVENAVAALLQELRG